MLADRWRREIAAACGFAALWFAVRGASGVDRAGALIAETVAAVLLIAAVRLAG